MAKKEVKTEAKEPTPFSPVRRIQVSPTFTSYYTNDTQIQTGPWDVRVVIGHIAVDELDSKEATSTRLAEIRMSPQHAVRLLEILSNHLAGYEQKYGPIPRVPKED